MQLGHRMLRGLTGILISAVIAVVPSASWACTGITLYGDDGTIVRGRTVEWGPFDLQGALDIVPRGAVFNAQTMPDGKPGHRWVAKYGMVGTSAIGKPIMVDGINEAGLSVGALYLPGFTEYADYDPQKADNSIDGLDVVGFLLTQFKIADEAIAGLRKIDVVGVINKQLGIPYALHFQIEDPSGKIFVVEFVGKQMEVYDAPLGVITNSPTYDWHLTNMRNYINLSAVAWPEKKLDGETLKPLGAGSGMIGLPGDFTPPSRFVRAVAFSQTARKTTGGYDTVREVFRVLDNFNVPVGAAEGSQHKAQSDDFLYSATQWTTAADVKNLKFYYHTQYSRRVREIDLKRIDFSKMGTDIISHPLDESLKEDIQDLTP